MEIVQLSVNNVTTRKAVAGVSPTINSGPAYRVYVYLGAHQMTEHHIFFWFQPLPLSQF
jgi:hypothetical protein